MNFQTVLSCVIKNESLEPAVAEDLMISLLSGELDEVEIAAILVAISSKTPSTGELSGFAKAILEAAEPIGVTQPVLDIVGTGGSPQGARSAVNVSTMASFIVAACGVRVCKHGNRKASSTSGSFDFLESLGLNLQQSKESIVRSVDEANIGFVFARSFHPALRFAAPVRQKLKVPTVFNVLGPLANPSHPNRMLLGVSDSDLADKMAAVLLDRGIDSAWVINGDDGLDEISVVAPTTVRKVSADGVEISRIDPSEYGLEASGITRFGGSAEDNKLIFEAILDGEQSSVADLVLINAAAALCVAGRAESLNVGLELAREAIADGNVHKTVEACIGFSQL